MSNNNLDESRTTDLSLLTLSREYINAFRILNDHDSKITYLFHIKFYLLAHSIELSFKAYLRHKGYSLVRLKSLRHDLQNLYKELSSKYLYKIDLKAIEMLNVINPYYSSKQFEYPTIGAKYVIPVSDLLIVADMINQATDWQIQSETEGVKKNES